MNGHTLSRYGEAEEDGRPEEARTSPDRAKGDPLPPSDPDSHPSSPSSISGLHISPNPLAAFALPAIPAARQSASSLMDAIFGDAPKLPIQTNPSTLNAFAEPFTSTSPPRTYPPAVPIQFKRRAKGVSRTPSGRSHAETDESVLSDAESRLNEGAGSVRGDDGEEVAELQKRGEVVDELQKKVDRRKSQLPQLESELALLEAQIKAAEERLARVQVTQQTGAGVTST